ncbi:uncharacterized protein EV422DRAFT_507412 [Fimicolochytrium jonesii]|uniref:uncharacterized protein n=1 Tax=Fimicolochytrium jonesii TaxID=1396493 RepID=UPI0022FE2F68|nr:uncharacterized protein EV422DRAFT_507412 [Fimicolochytrium jonesii]KAI8819327.1 hypothetical protein EV422DRAFT_507412 [Fimicolochytrium jonesii]
MSSLIPAGESVVSREIHTSRAADTLALRTSTPADSLGACFFLQTAIEHSTARNILKSQRTLLKVAELGTRTLAKMLRTPWGQDEGDSGAAQTVPTFSRKASVGASPGGRSQIVFGTYHEPSSSSYHSMTHTPRGVSRQQHNNNTADDYLTRNAVARQQSFRENSTDVFNLKPLSGDDSAGHRASAEPRAGNSGGSLRFRTDRNQSTLFQPQSDAYGSQSYGTPVREQKSASDIFHLQNAPQQQSHQQQSHYPQEPPSPRQTLEDDYADARQEPARPAKTFLQHNEYNPSLPSALKRNPSNSLLQPSDGPDDYVYRGRRHYPQSQRTSNIFQSN